MQLDRIEAATVPYLALVNLVREVEGALIERVESELMRRLTYTRVAVFSYEGRYS